MSCYDLSRLLFDLKMNEATYQKSLQDFESVLGQYDLSSEEKDALRSGDPQAAPLVCIACLSLYQAAQSAFRDIIYYSAK
jgi:hypothetical protein